MASYERCLNKGLTLYEHGQYQKALRLFNTVIRRNPNVLRAYWYKASCLHLLNESNEAIVAFNYVIELSTLNDMAMFAEVIRDRLVIERMLDQAMQRIPNDYNLYVLKGQYSFDETALTTLDYAIQLRPNDPRAYVLKGEALLRDERYNEALHVSDKAIRLSGCSLETWQVMRDAYRVLIDAWYRLHEPELAMWDENELAKKENFLWDEKRKKESEKK